MADYDVARPNKADSNPFPIEPADGLQYDLNEALGTENMRLRLWYFGPGESSSYHRHAEQEEVYYLVSGPGRMRLGEEEVDVPEGAAVRVSPETPRAVLNDGDEEAVWLIFSAPNVMEGDIWDAERGEFVPLEEWF